MGHQYYTAPKKQKKARSKGNLINLLIVLVILAVLAGLLAWNIRYDMTNYGVEFYKVESVKIDTPIRAVFVSDLHMREYGAGNADLLNDITNLKPDVILLGGDLVVDSVDNYDSMLDFCKKCREIAPVYGVIGNHESIRIYHHNDVTLPKRFADAGVRLLRNEEEIITVKNQKIKLVGVEGSSANFDKYGADKFMNYVEGERSEQEFKNNFTICLSHVPTLFPEKLSAYTFDLGLAGHVHGGVIRLPKVGGLFSREEGAFPDYTDGEYVLDNGAELIVSRGLGSSGRVPRINNVPELSVIDIQ